MSDNHPPNNVQLVREIMNFSEYGGLIQAFVIEALYAYSQHALTVDMPDNGVISPEAWKGCAQEVIDKLSKRYEK